MERRNYTAMLLLVFATVQIYSSLEGVNAQDGLAAIGSNGIAAENESSVDLPSGDEEEKHSFLPVKSVGQADKRIRRTPGASKNANKKLEKLKKALENNHVTPIVSRPEDIARTQRNDLLREFERIVARLMEQRRISRELATVQAMLENEGLVNQIVEAHD